MSLPVVLSSMKWLYLLRTFLPTWRFFEDISDEPYLQFRVFRQHQWTDWNPVFAPLRRSWPQLCFNPQVNYQLAAGSVVQHLLQELEDQSKLKDSAPFQLLQKLVAFEIHRRGISNTERFQFKLRDSQADLMISEEFPL